jgi:hypothetical protein
LTLAISLFLTGQVAAQTGTIEGVVRNSSKNSTPAAQVDVVLRAAIDGQFVPVAETATDAQGRFEFAELPVGVEQVYLPGANRDGVHYPGARVRLTAVQPHANVTLNIRDTIAEPNPLVVRRHEIEIRTETGVLRVSESMLIDNPGAGTYVGAAKREGMMPVTLQLHVPPDFERITFEQEFFGRRFQLINESLVTDVPWPPGERWLKFTYTLRNEQDYREWKRPLDLPGDQVQVSVEGIDPAHIVCNLPGATANASRGGQYEFAGETLPAGFELCVGLGDLPVSWMAHARWLALGVLVMLIAAGSLFIVRRRRIGSRPVNLAPRRGTRKTLPAGTPSRHSGGRRGRKGRSRRRAA